MSTSARAGAHYQFTAGQYVVWTDRVAIAINAVEEHVLLQATRALRPFNPAAAHLPTGLDNLPPPDFSACPDAELPR